MKKDKEITNNIKHLIDKGIIVNVIYFFYLNFKIIEIFLIE